MADEDGSELRVAQKLLQPIDAGEIEMVGGLVEKKNGRVLHQSLGNRQTLSPSARKSRGFQFEVVEASAAQRFRFPSEPFLPPRTRAFSSAFLQAMRSSLCIPEGNCESCAT